ncbi:MAG: hypothetical protein FK734_09430 [Asgard group archaeon]|nr:hypothetical protein [Asgard group archaeon]
MSYTAVKRITKDEFEKFFLVDMHIHTNNSHDCFLDIETILSDMSTIVHGLTFTDHDVITKIAEQTKDTFYAKYQLRIFSPAVEISSKDGDILAYGINSVPTNQLLAKEIIDIIHTEGGLAVAAHPFCFLGVGDLVFDLDFDAIEINGSRSHTMNKLAKEAAVSMDLPCIGGSDSHTQGQLGICVTKFTKQLKTIEELIEEVKKGNCSPVFLR